ncbi:MAG: type I restriction enzyme HsdR N-terminal domain-containing protein [Bacteroidetes bacterium]|jgi:hypothetical protein|nr:type I restriction enzyme HsdR N-terminal domain-containing protein [Bacteroidota bacterium]
MEFKDQIKTLSERAKTLKDQVATEEATKNALIMPFLQVLGYDVFNPQEIVPEYVADIGTKKGEKIDYAVLKDGQPIILVECKHIAQNLDIHDGQLLRYFHVSKARFAILSNGLLYRFYSDLVEPNKMDEKPFLEFNILEIKDNQVEELRKFHKASFDVESITSTASDLKYTSELKALLNQEFANPSDDFVRLLTRQVYPKTITAKVLEQFSKLVKRSVQQYLSDTVTERLKTALSKEDEADKAEALALAVEKEETRNKIVTTEEELEAFVIVKSILRQKLNVNRIAHRDAQTYFTILLDDNNRKTLCRLYLNGGKKYLAVLDADRKEIRKELTTLDDLYQYADLLLEVADSYEQAKTTA